MAPLMGGHEELPANVLSPCDFPHDNQGQKNQVSATRGVHRERRKQKPQADGKCPLKVLNKKLQR